MSEGRYELLGQLGEGSMGAVHRAKDTTTGDEVALKVIRPDVCGRPELIDRLRREVLAARRVTDPHVVRVFDLVSLPGGGYGIALELVRGETFKDRLARGRLEIPELDRAARELATGMAAAHRAGVLHRDLKPANMMVREDGRLCVMDFGLARVEGLGSLTQAGAVLGTPLYMSPEQLAGRPLDARSDVYALGAVLFEAATGAVPLTAPSLALLARKRLGERAPDLRSARPEVPAALASVIQRCLETRPEHRFRDADEVLGALESGGVVRPRPAARWPLFAGVTLIAAVAVGFLATRGRGLPSGPRHVALVVTAAGADARLGAAFSQLLARALDDAQSRFAVVAPEAANVQVKITLRRLPASVEASASIGRDGGPFEELGSQTAASVTELVKTWTPPLVAAAGKGLPELRDPTDPERAEMKRLGTASLVALRHFKRGTSIADASDTVDEPACERQAAAAAAADPGFIRAILLSADCQSSEGPRAAEAIKRAVERARGLPAADLGRRYAELQLAKFVEQKPVDADYDRLVAEAPDDIQINMSAAMTLGRPESPRELAILRRLAEQHPELQFGSRVVTLLRRTGQDEGARRFAQTWLERGPHALPAYLAMASEHVAAADVRAAEAVLRDAAVVFGTSQRISDPLAVVLTAAERYPDAAREAEKLLLGGEEQSVPGKFLLADIATYEGRIDDALSKLEQVVSTVEKTPALMASAYAPALQRIVVLHRVLGDDEGVARWCARAFAVLSRIPPARGGALAFKLLEEHALLRLRKLGRDVATPAALVASAEGISPPEAKFRRATLEQYDRYERGDCAGMLALPGVGVRIDLLSYELGACAARVGKLEEAERRLRGLLAAAGLSWNSAPIPGLVVAGRLELAGVLEKAGKKDEAIALYRSVIRSWTVVARAEELVKRARSGVARLGGTL